MYFGQLPVVYSPPLKLFCLLGSQETSYTHFWLFNMALLILTFFFFVFYSTGSCSKTTSIDLGERLYSWCWGNRKQFPINFLPTYFFLFFFLPDAQVWQFESKSFYGLNKPKSFLNFSLNLFFSTLQRNSQTSHHGKPNVRQLHSGAFFGHFE